MRILIFYFLLFNCTSSSTFHHSRVIAKDNSAYQEALASLKKDMQVLMIQTSRERWVFNYNKRINKSQYMKETLKDGGGLSPNNHFFIEGAKSQARKFFNYDSTSTHPIAASGLYFYIEPVRLVEDFTDWKIPVGTILKIPKGINLYPISKKGFLSQNTISLFNSLGYYSLSEKYDLPMLINDLSAKDIQIVYDAIKDLKIGLGLYPYYDSGFLELEADTYNTALILLDDQLLTKENTTIYDKHSLSQYPEDKNIQVLKKIAYSELGSLFEEIFWPRDDKSEMTDPRDLQRIIDKYLFNKSELKI